MNNEDVNMQEKDWFIGDNQFSLCSTYSNDFVKGGK